MRMRSRSRSFPPPAFRGRGTMRSMVERLFSRKNPLHPPSGGPPPLQRQGRKEEGFSLVELMVVIVIIGLLATIVIINVMPAADRAATTKARADIATLEQAIDIYKLDHLTYPPAAEGLQALVAGRYIRRLPNDPWGNPYRYTVPGRDGRPFQLASWGADGREGGSGQDADITN
jgi:general secretion pathway protein G